MASSLWEEISHEDVGSALLSVGNSSICTKHMLLFFISLSFIAKCQITEVQLTLKIRTKIGYSVYFYAIITSRFKISCKVNFNAVVFKHSWCSCSLRVNGFHSSSVISLLMCWDFRAGKHIERKSIGSIPGFSEVSFGAPNNFCWSCGMEFPEFPSRSLRGGVCMDLHTERGCCSALLLPLVQLQLPPFSPFVFQLLGMLLFLFMLLLSVLCAGSHGVCGQPSEALWAVWSSVMSHWSLCHHTQLFLCMLPLWEEGKS